jgi:hypothetical protein
MSEYREELWPVMMRMDGHELNLVVERGIIEPDHSFSPEAMEQLFDQIVIFVGTRIKRQWDMSGIPPTNLLVEIKVTTS